jgi:site-specific DNA-methyltransferase (adenine-specific)
MPESVTDRPTRSHEYIFLLSKSAKYYFDQEAVKEAGVEYEIERRKKEIAKGLNTKHLIRIAPGQTPQSESGAIKDLRHRQELIIQGTRNIRSVWTPKQDSTGKNTYTGFNKRWKDNSIEGRQLRSIWTITTKPFKEAHFATFPPELPERCIKAGCPVGGVVLDPFFGAGTTGMVARELGRDFIGIELNQKYCEMAERRISQVAYQMEIA